jgi:hypothetical protein
VGASVALGEEDWEKRNCPKGEDSRASSISVSMGSAFMVRWGGIRFSSPEIPDRSI